MTNGAGPGATAFPLTALPVHLLPAFLFWLFYVLRWPLLIAWAAITVVGIRRLINGPRRVKGIAKGVAIWALVGLITVNGFETAWKTANPEPYEVRMARSMLVEITQGAASKVCRVMPEDEARRLAEHYGESSCYDTVVRLGRRYRSFDEEFEDVEITLLGSREMSGEPVGVDSLTVHRARLGENLFGWREIEFVPGLEALVSVRW